MHAHTETCHHDRGRNNECADCGADMPPRDDRLPSRPIAPDGCRWLGAYSVGLAYGGPEEGGWWGTLSEHLASVLLRDGDDPLTVARELWEAYRADDDGREIHDSLASNAVCIRYESKPGEHEVRSLGRYS